MPSPVGRAQPAIRAPCHRLNGGLSAERASPAVGDRPSAQVDHVGLAGLGLDQIGVAGALQGDVGSMTRAQDVDVRVQLVRPEQRSGSRHRDGMSPRRAAFRRNQVVPAVALVEMRRLRQTEGCALEDVVPRADQFPLRRRIFLQHDAGEAVLPGAVVPQHVEQVLPPVVIMKERRIEPAAVQMDRSDQSPSTRLAGDEIVVKVAQ